MTLGLIALEQTTLLKGGYDFVRVAAATGRHPSISKSRSPEILSDRAADQVNNAVVGMLEMVFLVRLAAAVPKRFTQLPEALRP